MGQALPTAFSFVDVKRKELSSSFNIQLLFAAISI
jgi:hypothetical protein